MIPFEYVLCQAQWAPYDDNHNTGYPKYSYYKYYEFNIQSWRDGSVQGTQEFFDIDLEVYSDVLWT